MAFWTILTTALSLLSSISATPVNPVFHAGQGRNIQPLHCVSKTTKESGVCMFAWNCLKANGTHLGTCIDRFYFGSCCMIKDQQALVPTTTKPLQTQSEAQANPNAIDQNPAPEVWPVENVKFPTVAVGVSTTAPVPATGLPVSPVSTLDSVAASTSSEKPVSGSSSAMSEKTTSKINVVSTAPTVLSSTTKNPELTSTTVKADEKVTEKPISATVEPLANISTPAPSVAIPPSTFAPPSALPSVISTQAPVVTSTEFVLSTKEPEISPNHVDAVVQISVLAEVPTTPVPSLSPGMESSAPVESVSVSTDGAEQAGVEDVPPGAKPVPVLINVQSSVPDSATTPHFENAHPLQVDTNVQSSISPLEPTTVENVSEEEAATQVDLEAVGVDDISPSELSPSIEIENVAEEETTVVSQTSSVDVSMAVSISQTPAPDSGISTKVPDLASQSPVIIGEIDVAPTTVASLTGRPMTVISTEGPKVTSGELPPQQSSTVLPVVEPTMVEMEETTDKGEDVGTAGVLESTTDVPTVLIEEDSGTPPQAPEPSSSAPADPSPMTSSKPTEAVGQSENSTTSKPPSSESDKSSAALETTTHSIGSHHQETTVLSSSEQPISVIEVVLSSIPVAPETTVGPSTKGPVTTTQAPSSSANLTTSKPLATQAPPTNAKPTESPTTSVSTAETTTITVSFSQSPTTIAEGTEPAGTATKTAEAPQTTVVITEQPVTVKVTEPMTTGVVSEPAVTTVKDAELPITTEKPTEPPTTTDEVTSVPSTSVEATMPPSTTTSSTEQPTTTAKVIEPSPTIVKVTEQPTTTEKVTETPTTSVNVTQPPVTTAKITETPSTTAAITEPLTTTVKATEPPKTQPVSTTKVTTTTTTVLPTTTTTEALPEEVIPPHDPNDYKKVCGKPVFPQARIVNGETAAFGQWPWQISLRQWKTATFLHKCGAALLNENWAITAAHCVDNVQPEDILLRMGEYDLASENEPYNYTERRVQIVASHPKFDPRTFEYDLALLRFYDPVPFQPNIIPICIPEGNETYVGKTGYVTGWGRLYEDGPLPSKLQQVTVPVVTNSECEGMYRRAGYVEHIPGIFICAGYAEGKRDSCEGDSGGPMVIKNGDHWILGGVISWGIGCAEPNQPGVYTRITAFKDWINQIIVF